MQKSAQLAVVYRPAEALTPYAKNARTHSEAQVAQIAASIKEFGFTNPILVDGKNGVIAGHGRLLAAKALGMEKVPTIELAGLTASQKRAYVLADNRLALNAGWDDALLAAELAALNTDGVDLSLLGFTEAELATLMAVRSVGDPEVAPAPAANPVVQSGQYWHLGKHRLLIGDATDAASVKRLLAGAKPHLMVTDPPYGVNYDPSWRVKAGIGGAGTAQGKVQNDDRADWRAAWDLFPGAVCYVWHGGLHGGEVEQSLRAAKFVPRAQIIWVKSRLIMGRGAYHWQHEPAFYAQKQGAKQDHWRFSEEHGVSTYAVLSGEAAEWEGGRKQSTIWNIAVVQNDTGHGTQKPTECMRRPILNNSKPGDAVYDPFCGSGTTLIAAEMEQRVCYAMELSEQYAQVIIERWQQFTGKIATREDGKTLAQLIAGEPKARKIDAKPAPSAIKAPAKRKGK